MTRSTKPHQVVPNDVLPTLPNQWRHASLWLAVIAIVAACGGAVVDGTGGGGDSSQGGAASTTANTAVTTNSTTGTTGMTSSVTTGGMLACSSLGEMDCAQADDCVALFDFRDTLPGTVSPPDITPIEDPCCPECGLNPNCAACHTETFSLCVDRADCGNPLPDGVCGFPLTGNCP